MPVFDYTLFIWPFSAALIFDFLLGEYPTAIHPVVFMGRFISWALVFADRAEGFLSRFFSGALVVFFGLLLFITPLLLFILLWSDSPAFTLKWIILLIITAYCVKASFSIRSLLAAAAAVLEVLKDGDLDEARRRTAMHLVSRDTSSLNEDEISAAVIESISENLTDSVTAPLFYYLVGGPAAAFAYRFVNTCDSMMGYRNEKYEWLGKFAARFDDVLNFIPARISGWLIIAAAALLKGFSGSGALRTMFHEHRVTESPNAGWTMGAAAGALGVRLEKNGHYRIAGGELLPGAADIRRTITLVRFAVIILLPVILILPVLISGVFV